MTAKWKVHPFCERFPKMTAEERRETKESISRLGGLATPFEVFGGKIIDGRHRVDICEELGIDPGRPKEWHPPKGCTTGEEIDAALWEYVWALNGARRHLNPSQLAMIAVMRVTTKGKGRQESNVTNVTFSQGDAAKAAGVSRKTVNEAVAVTESGTPELQKAVTDGEVSVSDAAKIVDEPPKVQNAAVKAVKKKKAKTVAAAVKESKFDKPEDEKDQAEETIEQVIARKNHDIESFCRSLMSFVTENFPKDEWLDDLNRNESALQKFKDGCTTLRSAKCCGPCPMCQGEGCQRCRKTGRVPKYTRDQMAP